MELTDDAMDAQAMAELRDVDDRLHGRLQDPPTEGEILQRPMLLWSASTSMCSSISLLPMGVLRCAPHTASRTAAGGESTP